jgi:hypothetical protein
MDADWGYEIEEAPERDHDELQDANLILANRISCEDSGWNWHETAKAIQSDLERRRRNALLLSWAIVLGSAGLGILVGMALMRVLG